MFFLLSLALAGTGPAQPAPAAPPQRILTTLSPAGTAALRAELERIAGGRYRVEPAEDFDDLARAVRSQGGDVAALYGVAVAQLEELRALDGSPEFVRFPAETAEPSPIDAGDGAYLALFADCVVLAIDRVRAERDLGRAVGTILPGSLADLAAGKFEGAFFATAPDLDSAMGAWIGRLAVAEPGKIEERLVALGANLSGRETPHDSAAIERLRAEGPPAFAVVTESAMRRLPPGDPLEGLRVFGSSLAVIRGVARLSASEELLADLGALLAPDALARVAAAERVAVLRGAAPAGIDADDSVRRAIEMEGPRVGFEIGKIREWVPRYRGELRERLGKRRQVFEDVYDVAFLLALAVAGGWLLLRRKPADDPPRRGRADS